MAGFFRGLRDYGTTRLRDIAGDARVVSLARFPGVLSHSRAFPVLPSKSRALTSRAINLAHQSRAINLARPNYSHPTLASLPPRTTERTNKRTPRSLVRLFARSFVRLFARSLVRSFACSFVRSFACSLVRSFARSPVRPFARSPVRSFARSLVRPFVRSLVRSDVQKFTIYHYLLCVVYRRRQRCYHCV